jgi:hypothetical protein
VPLPFFFRRGNQPRSPQFYSVTPNTVGAVSLSQGGWRPSPNAQFNSAHPSANRLVALVPMSEGQGTVLHNIAAQAGAGVPASFNTVGTPAWDIDGSGLACLHTTPSSAGVLTGLSFPMAEFTMMAMVMMPNAQVGVSAGYSVIMGISNATDGFGMYNAGLGEGVNSGHAAFYNENSPGGSFSAINGLGDFANISRKCSVIILTASTLGSFQRIYVNGTLVNSAAGFSNAKTVTQAAFMDSPVIHDGRSTEGTAMFFALWSRALGGDEVELLSDQPYDLLLPPRRYFATFSTTVSEDIAATMANFAGSLVRSTSYPLAATMSNFAAVLSRVTSRSIAASMANFAGALTASSIRIKTLAASMLQFGGALARSTQKNLNAAMSNFAGALASSKSSAGATISATMANFAGALTRQTNYILTASMFGFQGSLALAVQHGGVPSVCTPAACTTITNIISHVEICENAGS